MIVLPAMPPEQTASWIGVLDLFDRHPTGWTLIGGQLVHLHCAERGQFPARPTNDADAVVDVRTDPSMLNTITTILLELGFTADGISADGAQHRWRRAEASIDVLLPDGLGKRSLLRSGASGSRSVPTAGGTQALQRTDVIAVQVGNRAGHVLRPNLLGALVIKAAALTNAGDPGRARHRRDFTILASLLTARDIDSGAVTSKDRKRLGAMIAAARADEVLILELPESASALSRLELAAGLS